MTHMSWVEKNNETNVDVSSAVNLTITKNVISLFTFILRQIVDYSVTQSQVMTVLNDFYCLYDVVCARCNVTRRCKYLE